MLGGGCAAAADCAAQGLAPRDELSQASSPGHHQHRALEEGPGYHQEGSPERRQLNEVDPVGDGGIPFLKDSAAVLARPYLTLPCAVVWLHHGFPPRHVRTQDSEKAAGQELRLAVLLDILWLLGRCSRAPCAAAAGLYPVPPAQGSPRHQHFGSQSHPQPGLGLMLRAEQPPGPPHLPSPRWGSLAPFPTKLSALQSTPWVL